MSDRVTVGDMPLDQPDPVGVGDVIAWRRLPVEVDELADWLSRLAGEWLDCELHARVASGRLEVFIAGMEDTTP